MKVKKIYTILEKKMIIITGKFLRNFINTYYIMALEFQPNQLVGDHIYHIGNKCKKLKYL